MDVKDVIGKKEIFRRCMVLAVSAENLVVRFEGEEETRQIALADQWRYLAECVWKGVTLNISTERIIVQPDYLIDISSIASCFLDNGPHALHYIFKMVLPSDPSAYALLGNTVNLFFDNKVQDGGQTYQAILQKTFHDDAIQFLSVNDEELRSVYFETIAQQYSNISEVVENQFPRQNPPLRKEFGFIEPSFICPELGISGRMDYMEMNGKGASIIELKSGKKDEFRRCSKPSHLIQTLLYTEALHFSQNIDYEDIHPYLLYNKYPELSKEIYTRTFVNQALRIRNQIVGYLHQIIIGNGERLFTEEAIESMYSQPNKLWDNYSKPALLEKIRPISEARPAMKAWFMNQLQFILREEELARIGDSANGKAARFNDRAASNIWRNDYQQKCADGKIISPMRVKELILNSDNEVTGFSLSISRQEEFSSHDFRKGDSIILYPIADTNTKAQERIIMHANIVTIDDDELTLELRNNERRIHFENLADVQFACEHDIINSNVAHSCRAVYRMLSAERRWQELLIEGAMPEKIEEGEKASLSDEDELVARILKTKEYFLLVGPPGTGKTSVLLRKILSRLYTETDENILLLSFTHRAVDEICKTLETIIAEDNAFLSYCRLGSEYECGEKKYSRKLLAAFIADCKRRSELLQKINDTRIFVGTTSRLNINHALLELKHFDTIIVDESSQLLDYQFVELLTNAKRFILIGDHKQLPAVTLQDTQRSLFERLYLENVVKNPSVVGLLTHQGRMHPDIAQFANEMFYDNRLDVIPLPHQTETSSVLPRFKFIDVKPVSTELFLFGSNKCNPAEAKAAAGIVKDVISHLRKAGEEISEKTIGIIVPYRNQISAIRAELANLGIAESPLINIDTVERYQGSQRDVIVFSATVSNLAQLQQLSAPVLIEGKPIDRKLNVIITRARKHIYIIGNRELLSQNPIYRQLIEKFLAQGKNQAQEK